MIFILIRLFLPTMQKSCSKVRSDTLNTISNIMDYAIRSEEVGKTHLIKETIIQLSQKKQNYQNQRYVGEVTMLGVTGITHL